MTVFDTDMSKEVRGRYLISIFSICLLGVYWVRVRRCMHKYKCQNNKWVHAKRLTSWTSTYLNPRVQAPNKAETALYNAQGVVNFKS